MLEEVQGLLVTLVPCQQVFLQQLWPVKLLPADSAHVLEILRAMPRVDVVLELFLRLEEQRAAPARVQRRVVQLPVTDEAVALHVALAADLALVWMVRIVGLDRRRRHRAAAGEHRRLRVVEWQHLFTQRCQYVSRVTAGKQICRMTNQLWK